MVNFIAIKCAQCTMEFGITVEFFKRRKADHLQFRCPNECRNYFPSKEPQQDEEKESLKNQVHALSAQVTFLQDQLEAAQASPGRIEELNEPDP